MSWERQKPSDKRDLPSATSQLNVRLRTYTYEVCSKNKVNFKISWAVYIRFSIFFSYVGTLLPNVCPQFQRYSIFFRLWEAYSLEVFCVCWRFSAIEKNGSKNMHQILCKNGIKCSKTLEMLKVAYGECTVSQKSVYKWYKLFTEGREEVNDDARPGRPSTSTTNENTEAVKKIVMENRRITIREVAKDVGISVGSCHAIFSDILVRSKIAEFWPKNPSHDHRSGNVEWRQRRSRFA